MNSNNLEKVLSEKVPSEYLNRWMTVQECRELAELMSVPDIKLGDSSGLGKNTGRIMTWNKLQEFLPSIGYTVEKARKRVNGSGNAVYCYRIVGEWHDVEVVADKGFMDLVAAKSNMELLEE